MAKLFTDKEEKDAEKYALFLGGLLALLLTRRGKERVIFQNGVFIVDGSRKITIEQIRKELLRLEQRSSNQASKILRKLELKQIDIEEWADEMRGLITSQHIIAGAIANGSISNAVEERQVKSDVETQLSFLERFKMELLAGLAFGIAFLPSTSAARTPGVLAAARPRARLTRAQLENRVRSYARQIYHSYAAVERIVAILMGMNEAMRLRRAAESCKGCIEHSGRWIQIELMPEIGSLECGPYCRCYVIYRFNEQLVIRQIP